jgi:hypothetical protein
MDTTAYAKAAAVRRSFTRRRMDTMADSQVFHRDHRAIVIFVRKPSARVRHQLNWILG